MKHTRGPWKVEQNKITLGNGHGRYLVADQVNHTEDAHLIAAAPDMLEELETCLKYFKMSALNGDEDAKEYQIGIEAALNKARGGKDE